MAGDARGDGQFPQAPPTNGGGEFLLSLLQRPTNRQSQTPLHLNSAAATSLDPAVAVVGPSVTPLPRPWQTNGPDLLYPVPLSPWPHSQQSLSTPVRPDFVRLQNFFPRPSNQFSGSQFAATQSSGSQIPGISGGDDDSRNWGFSGNHDRVNDAVVHNFSQPQENKLQFGSFNPTLIPHGLANGNSSAKNFKRDEGFRETIPNGFNRNPALDSHLNSYGNSNLNAGFHSFRPGEYNSAEQIRGVGSGGFYDGGNRSRTNASERGQTVVGYPMGGGHWDSRNIRWRGVNKEKAGLGNSGLIDEGGNRFLGQDGRSYERSHGHEVSAQLDQPERASRVNLHSFFSLDAEGTVLSLDSETDEGRARDRHQGRAWMVKRVESISDNDNQELDNIGEQLVDSLLPEDEPSEKSDSKYIRREKDCRGNQLLTERMRVYKSKMRCRDDIDMFTTPLLAIYASLIPPKEEKEKQKQLLTSLEKLVVKEWPSARLCVFGSCANSFGVSNSDIDVCLVLRDADFDKSEILLKLADILQSANLQNVKALTHARVPIIKLKDPVSGISCDICINNVLAVVNTKLLRDYAQIDVRLHQLAFIVKHWAKRRGVNETYRGTLSSYAYVLMCIHFLQLRRPPILPCLQGMKTTYHETVDNVKCAYFDQVDRLQTFGSHNDESIAELVWGFFNYWAYCHDYANGVISVRTGSIISKRAKDWTRRIGNDRHLICIEDPFETSHDLGRVVDRFSIRVLREEFERAAEILQFDPNPCEKLFEPFIHS